MRRTILAAAALATAGLLVGCDDETDEYTADLAVSEPIVNPLSAPTATGRVEMELEDDELTVTITIIGELTSAVTMAHIHGPASATQTAPIIFDFAPMMQDAINAGLRTGTILSATFELDDLVVSPTGILRVEAGTLVELMNSGLTYVNIHTVNNPTGEIRGQVARIDD